MKTNTIHSQLLDAIKDRLPQDNIAGRLMDILSIGKEAAYRRLRGEVAFTLEETVTIALELGMSIDDVMGIDNPLSRAFQLKLTGYVNPTLSDYAQKYQYIEFLSIIVQMPNTESGGYGNTFELALFYPYEYVTRFLFFKWFYQRSGKKDIKYADIVLSDEQRTLHAEYVRLSKKIKRTYYIWDYMIFQYLVNDINYFRDIDFISKEDLALLKQDLFSFVDYLEKTAIDGCFDTGNPVQFYISNINIESTYAYIQCDHVDLTLIKAFTLNNLASTNHRTTEDVKEWVLSQRRLATLISKSSEIQRIKFFKKQREIIATL